MLAALIALTLGPSAVAPPPVYAKPGGERRPICGFSQPPKGCWWSSYWVLEPCANGDFFGAPLCWVEKCELVCEIVF